ncbi:unnamed protein product, partial [Mycena citricolor]
GLVGSLPKQRAIHEMRADLDPISSRHGWRLRVCIPGRVLQWPASGLRVSSTASRRRYNSMKDTPIDALKARYPPKTDRSRSQGWMCGLSGCLFYSIGKKGKTTFVVKEWQSTARPASILQCAF